MKIRDFLVAAAALGFAACGTPYRATDTTVVVAPESARTAFVVQYPYATNATWSYYDATLVPIDLELAGWAPMDERDYVVRFNLDNQDYYAWYDEYGEWIGTAYVVRDYSTMPSPINVTVNNQFPGYSISSVNREFHKDKMYYEVELKNSNTKVKLLVDENGTIVKQKTKPLY